MLKITHTGRLGLASCPRPDSLDEPCVLLGLCKSSTATAGQAGSSGQLLTRCLFRPRSICQNQLAPHTPQLTVVCPAFALCRSPAFCNTLQATSSRAEHSSWLKLAQAGPSQSILRWLLRCEVGGFGLFGVSVCCCEAVGALCATSPLSLRPIRSAGARDGDAPSHRKVVLRLTNDCQRWFEDLVASCPILSFLRSLARRHQRPWGGFTRTEAAESSILLLSSLKPNNDADRG